MKQLLIFITDLFPYAAGETFIENEIQYLAAFDRIMIFPMRNNCLRFFFPDAAKRKVSGFSHACAERL